MTREEILHHLLTVFKSTYRIEERWIGGRGNMYFAESDAGPTFPLAITPRGYYLAYARGRMLGVENVTATRCLILGQHPGPEVRYA